MGRVHTERPGTTPILLTQGGSMFCLAGWKACRRIIQFVLKLLLSQQHPPLRTSEWRAGSASGFGSLLPAFEIRRLKESAISVPGSGRLISAYWLLSIHACLSCDAGQWQIGYLPF